ncbi:MAG: aldehyde dehydrogenase family protein, partial [Burkholderiaceae bacterium]
MGKTIKHLINGEFVDSQDHLTSLNPATGDALASVAAGGEAEAHAAVRAAHEAFPAWAARPAEQRAAIMRRLGELIAAESDAIAQIETQDTGQVIAQ